MVIQIGGCELENVLHLAAFGALTRQRRRLEPDYILHNSLEVLLLALAHFVQRDLIRIANAVLAQEIQLERVHGRGRDFHMLRAQRAATNSVSLVIILLTTNTQRQIVDDPRSSEQLSFDVGFRLQSSGDGGADIADVLLQIASALELVSVRFTF